MPEGGRQSIELRQAALSPESRERPVVSDPEKQGVSDRGRARRGQRRLLIFLKATLFGGLIFLLPLVLIAVLVGHGIGLAISAGQPVFRLLPHTAFWLALIPMLALLSLMLIALAAGLFARTKPGQQFLAWVEESLFGGVPQYQMMKSMAEGVAKMESGPGWQPVLVPAGQGWRIGFLVEEITAQWVAVFLPQSPSATIGEVVVLPMTSLVVLPVPMATVASAVKRMGVGLDEILRDVDLTPAALLELPEDLVAKRSGTRQTDLS